MTDRHEQGVSKFNFTTESGTIYKCSTTEREKPMYHVTRIAEGAIRADEFMAHFVPDPPVLGESVAVTIFERYGVRYSSPIHAATTPVVEIIQ